VLSRRSLISSSPSTSYSREGGRGGKGGKKREKKEKREKRRGQNLCRSRLLSSSSRSSFREGRSPKKKENGKGESTLGSLSSSLRGAMKRGKEKKKPTKREKKRGGGPGAAIVWVPSFFSGRRLQGKRTNKKKKKGQSGHSLSFGPERRPGQRGKRKKDLEGGKKRKEGKRPIGHGLASLVLFSILLHRKGRGEERKKKNSGKKRGKERRRGSSRERRPSCLCLSSVRRTMHDGLGGEGKGEGIVEGGGKKM